MTKNQIETALRAKLPGVDVSVEDDGHRLTAFITAGGRSASKHLTRSVLKETDRAELDAYLTQIAGDLTRLVNGEA